MKNKPIQALYFAAMAFFWTAYILTALILSVPVLLIGFTTIIIQAATQRHSSPTKQAAKPT